MRRNNYGQEEDDDYNVSTTGSFRLPDRDVYRRTFTTFGSVSLRTLNIKIYLHCLHTILF
jgi:hypothetical protein